jgi:hypothetical protein
MGYANVIWAGESQMAETSGAKTGFALLPAVTTRRIIIASRQGRTSGRLYVLVPVLQREVIAVAG